MKKSIFLALFLTFVGFISYAQTNKITISGTVTDLYSGIPIKGVTVMIKGSAGIGAFTDSIGIYTISVPKQSVALEFSYAGYILKEEIINGRTLINIQLEPSLLFDPEPELNVEEVAFMPAGAVSYEVSSDKVFSGKKRSMREASFGDEPIANNTEEYSSITENTFKSVKAEPLSTLSIDVDNASYSNVRRFLNNNQLPQKDVVRIEEMINYFDYEYPNPTGKDPFSFVSELSECPWNKNNKLLHVGIQGKKLDLNNIKPSNLVFLLDVSGSMSDVNKLPLLIKSFKILLNQLDDKDKVSIVVYAGAAGIVLPPTSASEKQKIIAALDNLHAGGSTAGGEGIELAYQTAKDAYIQDGNNRVILATDGDFNVGVSSTGSLVELIEKKRQDDIYLTILGLGMGNYKDSRMEEISNAGNGNYFYIDNIKEAEKVFGKQMQANMFTIAKDVKIQIEFNPANVKAYRLIGYENRLLANEDFNDDKKDAGELGAGHTVTALYEIVTNEDNSEIRKTDELKYQQLVTKNNSATKNELLTIKFRYKRPKENKSNLIEYVIENKSLKPSETSDNFRFSASVALFGMILRDSEFKKDADFKTVKELAGKSLGKDTDGYRAEFLRLVEIAELLKGK